MIAESKKITLAYRADRVKIEYPKEIIQALYHFMHDTGARHELPDGEQELHDFLTRMHETLSIDNPIFPLEPEFGKVYARWMSDVLRGAAPRKGNNISALLICLNDWLQQHRDEFLPEKPPATENVTYQHKPSLGEKLEEWPDEIILQQLRTLKKIGGNGIKARSWMKTLYDAGGRGYTYRLSEEAKRRGIKA